VLKKCTKNVVYTFAAKFFNVLEIGCLGRQRLGDNFSPGTLKNDFAALIYKYLFSFATNQLVRVNRKNKKNSNKLVKRRSLAVHESKNVLSPRKRKVLLKDIFAITGRVLTINSRKILRKLAIKLDTVLVFEENLFYRKKNHECFINEIIISNVKVPVKI
jgi:hypothetical protein